jgi:hypothetical protein
MVTRFARSASMIHAKEGRNGEYASGDRQLTFSLLDEHDPLRRYLQASHHQAWRNGRRFQ